MTLDQFADRYSRDIPKRLTLDARKLCIRAALMAEGQGKVNAGKLLKVRSGRLRASIAGTTRIRNDVFEIVLRAGGEGDANVSYAAIHEYGGIIRPKRGRFLTIPLKPAKTARGVSRFRSARDVPGLALVQSKKGQYMLVKSDTGEPWYLLRQRVAIPARPYLLPALEVAADDLAIGLKKLLGDLE